MAKRSSHGVANPSSAIFIGNSFFYYNNGVNHHLNQMLLMADPKFKWRQVLVAISGAGLDWHDVESYFRPNALSAFGFDPDNNIVFNKFDRLFDLAIMMDGSQSPIHPALVKSSAEFARRHCDTVRRHGGTPILFETWAYADKPEMTAPLAEAYARMGAENDAMVIPAGQAFARSLAARPDIGLHAPDKRHPSLAGTYLSSCLIYAAIFGKSPEGMAYHAELPRDVATHLQSTAWAMTEAYNV
jgi:hypothetical protein